MFLPPGSRQRGSRPASSELLETIETIIRGSETVKKRTGLILPLVPNEVVNGSDRE